MATQAAFDEAWGKALKRATDNPPLNPYVYMVEVLNWAQNDVLKQGNIADVAAGLGGLSEQHQVWAAAFLERYKPEWIPFIAP